MLIVPATLPRPVALASEGPLLGVGRACIDFQHISHALAQEIAIRGYGIANTTDEALIRESMLDPTA